MARFQRGRASFSLPPRMLPELFPEYAKRSQEPIHLGLAEAKPERAPAEKGTVG